MTAGLDADVVGAEAAADRRDEVVAAVTEHAGRIARELARLRGGDYGSFSARVDGSRWELKWEDGRTSYLRVGGEGGVYLLTRYRPPSARDLRTHADDFAGFVDAFNEHVADVSETLETVSL